MAKAKKQDGEAKAKKAAAKGEEGAAKKRAGAPKAEVKPRAPTKTVARKVAGGSAGSPAFPTIDTSLAAAAAASMVLNRFGSSSSGAGSGSTSPAPSAAAPQAPADAGAEAGDAGEKRETSAFKQLKQSLSKPASQGLGGILGGVQAGKKTTQTFAGPNQVRRNQTFGADASRTNVPRRTGG